MKKWNLLFFSLFFFLLGCFEEERTLIFNPDGSGKLLFDYREFPQEKGIFSSTEKNNLKQEAEKKANQFMQNISGVEGWGEVDYEIDKKGVFCFTGTAYFPDITKLKFREGRSRGGVNLNFLDFHCRKDDRGNWEFFFYDEKEEDNKEETKEVPKMKKREVRKAITAGRKKWKEEEGMKWAHLKNMKASLVIEFSGKVASIHNFKKQGKNKVSLSTDGMKIMKCGKKMHMDNEWAKEIVKAKGTLTLDNGCPESLKEQRNKMLFKDEGPIELVIEPGEKALFDYQAEREKISE